MRSNPAVDKNFHFVILGPCSLQLELAHANEINHDIHIANTVLDKGLMTAVSSGISLFM